MKEVYYNLEYAPFLDGYRITKAQADFVLKDKIAVGSDYCNKPQVKSNDKLPGAKAADPVPVPDPPAVQDPAKVDSSDNCYCRAVPASEFTDGSTDFSA